MRKPCKKICKIFDDNIFIREAFIKKPFQAFLFYQFLLLNIQFAFADLSNTVNTSVNAIENGVSNTANSVANSATGNFVKNAGEDAGQVIGFYDPYDHNGKYGQCENICNNLPSGSSSNNTNNLIGGYCTNFESYLEGGMGIVNGATGSGLESTATSAISSITPNIIDTDRAFMVADGLVGATCLTACIAQFLPGAGEVDTAACDALAGGVGTAELVYTLAQAAANSDSFSQFVTNSISATVPGASQAFQAAGAGSQ